MKKIVWLVLSGLLFLSFGFARGDALHQQAEQGDANSQAMLGLMYSGGLGTPRDDAQAIQWFRKAAEQGNATAQCGLGRAYEEGRGVPKDNILSVEWYRKAAEQENDQSKVQARMHLRQLFVSGKLIPKVDDHTGKWWRKLAEQANAEAQSFTRLHTAAERGGAVDQVNLGLAYLRGIGTPKDRLQATLLFRKAAEQGQSEAQCLFAAINASDDDWNDSRIKNQAFESCQKASKDGFADAQLILGTLYNTGRGVHKDESQGQVWIRKAAEQGRSDAQWLMGYAYKRGNGVQKDETQSNFWFRKSADNGNPAAIERLGLDQAITPLTEKNNDQENKRNVERLNLAAELQPEEARDFLKNMWASAAQKEQERQIGKEMSRIFSPVLDNLTK